MQQAFALLPVKLRPFLPVQVDASRCQLQALSLGHEARRREHIVMPFRFPAGGHLCDNSPYPTKGKTINRSKALAAALSQIEKQFGKGSIMRLGASDVARDIQVISTGSLGLDIALGVGGCLEAG